MVLDAAGGTGEYVALCQLTADIPQAFCGGAFLREYGFRFMTDGLHADLRATLQEFTLEFVENQVESLLIEGNTAFEQTLFAIRGTPKGGGAPFLFKGRTMVVYIRYKNSPTGWASIREMIQPATD